MNNVVGSFFKQSKCLTTINVGQRNVNVKTPVNRGDRKENSQFKRVPLFPAFHDNMPASRYVPLAHQVHQHNHRVPVDRFLKAQKLPVIERVFRVVDIHKMLGVRYIHGEEFQEAHRTCVVVSQPFGVSKVNSTAQGERSQTQSGPLVKMVGSLQ